MTTDVVASAMAEMTHLPAPVAQTIAELSAKSGLEADQLRLLFCFLLAIPLGWIHKQLSSIFVKHLSSTVIGFGFCYFVVGYGCFHQVISSFVTYLIVLVLLPRSPSSSKKNDDEEEEPLGREQFRKQAKAARDRVGIIVFVWAMLYISGSHIYRLYVDYLGWRIDFTMPQMIFTLKMISFAWARVDGEALNAGEAELFDKESENNWRKSHALRNMPSLFEYYAWLYFFPGALAGPAFDAVEYFSYADNSMFRKFGLEQAPSSLGAPFVKLFYAVCCYPLTLVVKLFPLVGYVGTDKFFAENTWWQRIVFPIAVIPFFRIKYYMAW